MEIHFESGLKRPHDATESTKLVSEAAIVVRCLLLVRCAGIFLEEEG